MLSVVLVCICIDFLEHFGAGYHQTGCNSKMKAYEWWCGRGGTVKSVDYGSDIKASGFSFHFLYEHIHIFEKGAYVRR